MTSEPQVRIPWYKVPPVFASDVLIKKAEDSNPEIKRQSLRVDVQSSELSAAKYDSWPGFTLTGSYSDGAGKSPERNYGLGVSFPLPIWNANRGAIAASESMRQAEEVRLKWAREKMNMSLKSALEHYRMTSSTIKDLSPDGISDQERDMRDVDRHFKKGQIDLITYIEADAEHFDSLNAILDAQVDFVSALRELLFLVGEAPQPLEI
jgi:cobalt-zinc-cadmium efflux system outer membrane protein